MFFVGDVTKKIITSAGDDFYQSEEWLRLRYQALHKYGNRCMCCGYDSTRVEIHVDHIKPRSLFPELALDVDNLQILCRPCNIGKSNIYIDDWRKEDPFTLEAP